MPPSLGTSAQFDKERHYDQAYYGGTAGPPRAPRTPAGVPTAAPPVPHTGPSQETWGLHQNILKDYNDRAAKETDPARKAEIQAQSAEVHNAYLQGRPYPD